MSKNKQNKPRPDAPRTSSGRAGGPSASRREQLRQQQAAAAQRARTQRIITVVGAVLAVAIIAFVAVVLFQNQREKVEQGGLQGQTQITPPSANAEQNALVYRASDQNTDMPSVEVFVDFQCPGCRTAAELVDPILHQLADAGEIQLTFHYLHGLDRGIPGNNSQRATIALTCADDQGLFPEYAEAVFANQPQQGVRFTDEQLGNQFASQAGLTGDQLTNFQACFNNNQTSDFVTTMQEAQPDYVTHTPFVATNGTELDLNQLTTLDGARQAIAAAA